ncbi:MAG: bifunctional pyr operon transcriptional regulator/uracil phosphoribosyltransferase PyrR [bacterium]|nr:bifunctional pyr operon transcriptional regulator/uracil phosphoribosyltransferase PyrR [bacterium]
MKENTTKEKKTLLNEDDIENIISEISQKIYEEYKNLIDIDHFAIIGVQTRGVEIANRIKEKIENLSSKELPFGTLDITFHRDDIATRGILPVIKETRIEFDITKMTILLVDDVIFTGRTMKAALETLMTFGRPSAIRLFELIDRGNRELPIQPDYCGYQLKTSLGDLVKVRLIDTDGIEDSVVLVEN